jgi:hypothetical protein
MQVDVAELIRAEVLRLAKWQATSTLIAAMACLMAMDEKYPSPPGDRLTGVFIGQEWRKFVETLNSVRVGNNFIEGELLIIR